jgi:hypothetical protein
MRTVIVAGIISLAGISLTAIASLLTLHLTNKHNEKIAQANREHELNKDQANRAFELEKQRIIAMRDQRVRYNEIRREIYANILTSAADISRSLGDREAKFYRFQETLTELSLISTSPVVGAAGDLGKTLVKVIEAGEFSPALQKESAAAREAFLVAAQREREMP